MLFLRRYAIADFPSRTADQVQEIDNFDKLDEKTIEEVVLQSEVFRHKPTPSVLTSIIFLKATTVVSTTKKAKGLPRRSLERNKID